jgi:CDP-6-deoxy-D-xylo-4-hexulose-3-dehydrase
MIRLISETIDKDDVNALCEWLQQEQTPQLTKGSLTRELEAQWAEKVGTNYSVFVNSGSSAILLTLAAMKEMGLGRRIVIPALSWSTDLGSALILDYEPILCDCNLEDLSVSLEHLEFIFRTERPDALLLVSVLGLVPQMAEIVELCARYKVTLVEDACESMGSKYRDRYLGSFGEASCFSMFFGHHVSTIEGGFINTNNKNLYDMLLMMRSHGWARDLDKETQATMAEEHEIDPFNEAYTFYVPGMNLRSTDLQAFLGLRAINKLDSFSATRENNFRLLQKMVGPKSELNLRYDEEDFISNFAYPFMSSDRAGTLRKLEGEVETRPLIAGNIAVQPVWEGPETYLPNAAQVHKKGLYLPNHQDITDQWVRRMAAIL